MTHVFEGEFVHQNSIVLILLLEIAIVTQVFLHLKMQKTQSTEIKKLNFLHLKMQKI